MVITGKRRLKLLVTGSIAHFLLSPPLYDTNLFHPIYPSQQQHSRSTSKNQKNASDEGVWSGAAQNQAIVFSGFYLLATSQYTRVHAVTSY